MQGNARCVGRPWGRSHGRRRASLYQAAPTLSVLRNGDKGQDAHRNPRFQPPKLKSPFRGASVQAEGADRPLRVILASGAGGDAFGEGAFEPDSPLRGILGGGGFCTFPWLRRRRAPLKPVGAGAVGMCENRAGMVEFPRPRNRLVTFTQTENQGLFEL